MQQAKNVNLTPIDNRRLQGLCGQCNENLRHIEKELGVKIHHRGSAFSIFGSDEQIAEAEELLMKLYDETANQIDITAQKIHLILREKNAPGLVAVDDVAIQAKNGLVKPRSQTQLEYLRAIQQHVINFGIGPAGTGKTFLAVANAVQCLERDEVNRIILVRPVVEAGESLGFLPGDIAQKIDPYLRPLFDSLGDMLGSEKVTKLLDKNTIEVAPLAYMRGRTLNDSFVILDEAQNTTVDQMKMFLTRIGFGSRVVVTGDISQIDLPRGHESGLVQALKIFRDIEGISFTLFKPHDVVRHPLVKKIVDAYHQFEKYDKSK